MKEATYRFVIFRCHRSRQLFDDCFVGTTMSPAQPRRVLPGGHALTGATCRNFSGLITQRSCKMPSLDGVTVTTVVT
jgi:hypothetical protein